MDIAQAVEGLRQHLETFVNDAKARLETELPVVADVAQKTASNPAFAALASAVHLPEAPATLQTIADLITKMDADLGAAKAAGAAEAQQAAAAAVQAPVEVQPAEVIPQPTA